MIKKSIKSLITYVSVVAVIIMAITIVKSNCEYNELQKDYDELLNQPPKIEYVEKEVEVEVIKEVPVYTEAEAMSEEDFFLLCQLIYKEAGSSRTSNFDRTLVGNVALNRLACNYRGADTLKEVIYSRGQYTTARSITKNEHVEIPMSSVLAAYRLALGNRYCPNNVIFQSQSRQGSGTWKKVGNHYYCYSNSIEVDEHQIIKEFEE